MSICVVKELPFALNMVLTRHNCHELETMIKLVAKLGSQGVRFGHLLATPATAAHGLDLSFPERRTVEQTINTLAQQAPLPIVMAPGYFTNELFPCAPLNAQEININCAGELTTCCHLSGYGDSRAQCDVMGDLAQVGFATAYARLQAETAHFCRHKAHHAASESWRETDFLPCHYCARYYGKYHCESSRFANSLFPESDSNYDQSQFPLSAQPRSGQHHAGHGRNGADQFNHG